MNNDSYGKVSYEELRQIIFDYFKKNQGIELSSGSIDYLKGKLMGNNDPRPFFTTQNEYGKTKFDISSGDIQKIFSSYLASQGWELSSIEYGYNVEFRCKQNAEIDHSKEVNLDITYNGEMDYNALRQMVFDYYKENKGIQLGSISIDYLKNKMTGENLNNSQPFFIMKDATGEKRFDIPKEEMQEILNSYLAKKNCKLIDLKFGNSVEYKYKQGKEQKKTVEQEKTESETKINEFGEIIRDGAVPTNNHLVAENVPYFEPQKEEKKTELKQGNDLKTEERVPVKDEPLERMAREKRKFTILQRERAMNEARSGKNYSAIMAGLCILGAATGIYFNGQNMQQVVQQELNAVYSWEALGQYIQNLGPLTTLLSLSAGGFIAKYFKHSKKFKQAQNEFIDFNNSLENIKTEELGGNGNVKSR